MHQKRIILLGMLLPFFTVGAADFSPMIRVAIQQNKSTLHQALSGLLKQDYNGTIRVLKDRKGQYFAVNTLDVEDYLLDVIGQEMSPKAPLEALKAQAIAARTHALYQASISDNRPYDLIANLSQAYEGRSKLSKNVILAIESTRGMVLQRQKNPFPALFHSSCGGHTDSIQDVWGKSAEKSANSPTPVSCPACAKSSHDSWKFEISVATFRQALQKSGYTIGANPHIQTSQKSAFGRILNVNVTSEAGNTAILAEKFRSIMGYHQLKSTLFNVTRPPNPDGTPGDLFVFQGSGFGHGVGLCQHGASQMAAKGASCGKILTAYFPGCKIVSQSQG